uniref:Cystin-1 n=1 Tax=Marmota marmota marmota TaxID=9994 RepID=A0A8C6A7G4_MARMA
MSAFPTSVSAPSFPVLLPHLPPSVLAPHLCPPPGILVTLQCTCPIPMSLPATATAAEAPGAGATAAQEETLRLLDQLLAESAAWGPQEPVPRGAARPRPAAGVRVCVEPAVRAHPSCEVRGLAPSSSHKRPERQSAISYDYAEEELMASIEREYCR